MIDIATGKSRNQKTWKNQQISWEALVKKFSKTHRTAETYTEYMAASKDRQAEIKDIGGFVGAYLPAGSRAKGNAKHRQLITLDVDFAPVDLWDDFTMIYDCAALIHSTHKHSSENPRYRLVIPLSRPVDREEYVAIARRIAGNLGIGYFDSTTFQPERLMYWPSTSSDGEYVFESQGGAMLDPDKVLATYRDWRDISEWPVCDNEKEIENKALSKQQDPTLKKGLIGAFCRAYPITEAIDEFLPGVYVPVTEDRYTYTAGTTAGGALLYNDLFLYSHHSTDPVGGLLVNAFDLVRIHKFGELDSDLSMPVVKRESYKEMMELLGSNTKVIGELGAFAGLGDSDWLSKMDVNQQGMYRPTINNFLLIVQNDENLAGAYAYNQFEYRDFLTRDVPWSSEKHLRSCTDKDDAGLRHYMENTYKIFNVGKMQDAVDISSVNNGFHPVRDYIDKLVWDGEERLERLFIDHLGANNNSYVKSVTKKAMVAAIARVYRPGIKFDYVLTLVGAQGIGKSSIFRELGKDWYSDSMGNMQNNSATEQIQGVWIMEMAELAGLKKTEIEVIKHFITKQVDRFRVAYGKRVAAFPRQCIFFGTTNEVSFLRDATGNRRFWPIVVSKKYKHGSINVDQIWAEAKVLWDQNEALYLDDELEAEANKVQKHHAESDDRAGLIEKYLKIKLPESWEKMSIYERRSYISGEPILEEPGTVVREKVCVAEVWCEVLRGELRDMTTNNTKFIHNILQNVSGWERGSTARFGIYGTQRCYTKVKKEVDILT